MSIDVKVTRNDMANEVVTRWRWMITVTVQNGENAAMQYCRLSDIYPDAETVGKVVEGLYKSIMSEVYGDA